MADIIIEEKNGEVADTTFKQFEFTLNAEAYLHYVAIYPSVNVRADNQFIKAKISTLSTSDIGDSNEAGVWRYFERIAELSTNGAFITESPIEFNLHGRKLNNKDGKIYVSVKHSLGGANQYRVELGWTKEKIPFYST